MGVHLCQREPKRAAIPGMATSTVAHCDEVVCLSE
jgi:hypothetical protein